MAIAHVANRAAVTGTGGGTTTVTFSPASTAASGHLVVGYVTLQAPGGARTLNSVADNSGGGNVWQVDVQKQSGTATLIAVFSCSLTGSITSSTTITLTWSGTVSTKYAINLDEFSGAATSSWFDVSASATGSGTALTAGTTTSAASGDLGIACWGIAATEASFTPDGSHTAFGIVSQTSCSALGEYNVSVSGAQSATGTAGTTGGWAGAQATYKIGGTTTPQTVSVTTTVNPSITRTVSKTVAQTATVTPSIARTVSKIVAVSSTVNATVTKSVSKIVSLATTVNPTLLTGMVKLQTVAQTVTVAPTLTTDKTVAQAVSQSVTVVPTLTTHKATVIQQVLSVTVTVTGTIRRCVSRLMGGDSPGSLAMSGDTAGTLTAVGDSPGTLTLTTDTPGGLSLTADTPGSLGSMEPGCR